jgi:uncharacterized membrane protein YdjX (TVP38/TMEM64 family)
VPWKLLRGIFRSRRSSMNTPPTPLDTSNAVNSAPEDAQRPPRFGLPQAVALVLAITIPVLIYVFRDEMQTFKQLGYLGAFLTMFVGNATVILPVPGLILVFVLGGTLHPLLVGLAAGPGAALGELVAYFAGFSGSGVVKNISLYQDIERSVKRYGPVVIAILAAIPNPLFDMAGLISGALGIRWWQFLLAAGIGKTIQAIAIAYAGSLSLGWVEQILKQAAPQ